MPNTAFEPVKKTKVAILRKDGIYGAIGMFFTASHFFVSNYDPRRTLDQQHFHKSLPSAAAAEQDYLDALATSRDRGFTVVYNGRRNFG